jgi:hypothetical protein
MMMPGGIKTLKYILIFCMLAGFMGCAPAKKNTYTEKRKKSSQVSSSQLGRNKYYFSSGYQKKLNKNYKKR